MVKLLPRRHPSLGDVGLQEEHSRWEMSDVKGQETEVFLKHWFTEPQTTADGTRYDTTWATSHRTLEISQRARDTCISIRESKGHGSGILKNPKELNGFPL